jgi:glycosyltransferase involved in cell wall biosynthesis
MRLLFLISGRQIPSSRFRILQFIAHLQARGHTPVVAASRPPKYRGWPVLGNRLSQFPRVLFRLADLGRAWRGKFDVVVLERELFSGSGSWRMEHWFRRLAQSVVLDVDDGLHLDHPRKFAALATMADVVVVGNRLLADQAALHNPHAVVVPTVVDTDRYRPREAAAAAGGPLVLGWTGTAANIPYLAPILPALRQVARKRSVELRVIAERDAELLALDLTGIPVRFQPWREATEAEDLLGFDIGLMPLASDPWSRAKCGLKVLQYMACGIPALASPVGVNTEIIQDGDNGLLADGPQTWADHLWRLAADPALRARLGAAGRRTVENRYSIHTALPLLERAYEDAAQRGRARKRTVPA